MRRYITERNVSATIWSLVLLYVLFVIVGCGGYGPTAPGDYKRADPTLTASVADPTDDMFGGGDARWDLTALTVTHDTGGLTIALDLSRDVVEPGVGRDSAALYAVIDLDLDQNPATGDPGAVDEFRLDGGSSGLGADVIVNLFAFAPDSTVFVLNGARQVIGLVKPAYVGRRLTVRLPRALIHDDDGTVNAAAIVGNRVNPTDFVPNTGHLTLGARP